MMDRIAISEELGLEHYHRHVRGNDCTVDCCDVESCEWVGREPACVDGEGHDWVATGGLRENPGVQSLGGTTLVYTRRCALCGCQRQVTAYGRQRNRYQCDSVEYTEAAYEAEAEGRSARRDC